MIIKKAIISLIAIPSIALPAAGLAVNVAQPNLEVTGKYIKSISQKDIDDTINSIVAVDALGRSFNEADVSSSNKQVGLFYHIWHGSHTPYCTPNITDLLSNDPEILFSKDTTVCGTVKNGLSSTQVVSPLDHMHYWDEPLYGFYSSSDPWIAERHLELLTMSSIDYLCLDLTNLGLYDEDYCKSQGDNDSSLMILMDKMVELADQGFDVPKVFPYFGNNDNCVGNCTKYYNLFFVNENNYNKYSKIFYRDIRSGKPLLAMGNEKGFYDDLDSNIANAFSTRIALFPYSKSSYETKNNMLWISYKYPQPVEEMNTGTKYMTVSVAQHRCGSMSATYPDATYNKHYEKTRDTWNYGSLTTKKITYNSNSGRGYSFNKSANNPNDVKRGTNLEYQWATAFDNQNNLDEVMVTGFNEWIATKMADSDDLGETFHGETTFVDQFNLEFSRDIEMTKDNDGDNFVLQNMRNTRAFKSNKAYKNVSNKNTKNINDITMWPDGRTYVDVEGDAIERTGKKLDGVSELRTNFMRSFTDGKSVPGISYTNFTNRNDISTIQMINDDENLYFRVNCVDRIDIEDPSIPFIGLFNIHGYKANRWNGYNFKLDLNKYKEGKTPLSKIKTNGSFDFESVSNVVSILSDNVFICKIPLKDLGITNEDFVIDFKVADSIGDPSNIMNYYIDGDSAPIGRLSYRYNGGK